MSKEKQAIHLLQRMSKIWEGGYHIPCNSPLAHEAIELINDSVDHYLNCPQTNKPCENNFCYRHSVCFERDRIVEE